MAETCIQPQWNMLSKYPLSPKLRKKKKKGQYNFA